MASAYPSASNQQPYLYPQPSNSQPNYQQRVHPETGNNIPRGFQQSFAHTAEHSSLFKDGMGSGFYTCMMTKLGDIVGTLGTLPCCFCFPNPYQVVQQGSVGLFTRFGRYIKTVDPGLHYVNLYTESMFPCDIKIQTVEIPRQVAITKDNVTVIVDSVLYWQVEDPFTVRFQVGDVGRALAERTQTTLRQVIGSHDLQDIIVNREGIAHEIQSTVKVPAHEWGVQVSAILIKDLQFSQDLQDSLSSAAKQKRLGAARVIAAQAEVESARLMREAADILNSTSAMQIRYLDTLKSMAHEGSTKVIFVPHGQNIGGMAVMNSIAEN